MYLKRRKMQGHSLTGITAGRRSLLYCISLCEIYHALFATLRSHMSPLTFTFVREEASSIRLGKQNPAPTAVRREAGQAGARAITSRAQKSEVPCLLFWVTLLGARTADGQRVQPRFFFYEGRGRPPRLAMGVFLISTNKSVDAQSHTHTRPHHGISQTTLDSRSALLSWPTAARQDPTTQQ